MWNSGLTPLVVGLCGHEVSSCFGPVGLAAEGEDLGVVDETADHRGDDDVIGEDLAPAAEWHARGHQDRALLVAVVHELEEQVGGVGVERDVADLVDDEQLVAAQLAQLGL